MKRRCWGFLCMVLVLLLTGCTEQRGTDAAGPEMSGCFSTERSACRTGLAEVGGQVYGLSGYEGYFGLTTPALEKWYPDGTHTRAGLNATLFSEIEGIAALGDGLLVKRIESNVLTVLDHSAHERRLYRFDPATKRSTRMEQWAFAAQGQLYRAEDGQLLRLSADGSSVLQAWPGELLAHWDSFALLEVDGVQTVMEFATGACYPAPELAGKAWGWHEAVLEGGVMYLLEETALTAANVSTGERRTLITYPADAYDSFLLSAERIILLGSGYRDEPHASAVYDRATLDCTLTFTHMAAAVDALLAGDVLYLRDPYSGGATLGNGESWYDPAAASIIDLTTGREITWELND